MKLLEINEVSKVYSRSKKNKGGQITALDSVSLSLDRGEILGLIGPNGAGKSTLIKCITGLATQTGGSIKIDGYDTVKEHVASIKKVGAIIESPDMFKNWTAVENLTYLASLSCADEKLTKEEISSRVDDLLKLVGLYERRKDKVSKYSLGMKQRLGIAQALLNKPSLLILDEPANGLDPEGIKEVRDIVIHLAHDMNMGILISSHNLSELQLTCDRFAVIKRGKLLAELKSSDFTAEDNGVIVTVDDVVKAKDVIMKEFSAEATQIGDGKLEFCTEATTGDVAKTLILNGVTVSGISAKERTLESIFLKLTEVSDGKNEIKNQEKYSVKSEEKEEKPTEDSDVR